MTVSADGLVTLVGTGIDMVTLSHSCLSASYKFKIDSAILPDGTYFLKNKRTEKYVDIYAQNMANGTDIHQWDFHGGNTQRWIFSYLGEGYYTFKSANSSDDYYLVVKNDGTATDTQIVLRTGTITDGMKWKITDTASGAYKITPKTGEPNDRVLAVGWYAFNVNGIDIKQRDYIDDGNYIDEWYLTLINFTASVYNFYDNGYSTRYGENGTASVSKINSYINDVSMQYLKIFGVEITAPTATYYNSAIDTCKGTVNSSNINKLCTHTNPHTILFNSTNSVSNHFNNNTSPAGSNVISKVYWSGHRIQTYPSVSEYNRCYSSGNSIYMLELSSSSDRDRDSKGILMHELNHQFGAPDHYHEILSDGSCRGGDICSECGEPGLQRPSSCIMYQSRISISTSTVICDGCQADIFNHLNDHH